MRAPAVSDWIRTGAGRVIYAVVLWVVIFSTLEQFAGVNDDLLKLNRATFHVLAFTIAAVAAVFEAVTLRGISGLLNLWQRPDPIASIVNRTPAYKAAFESDLHDVRKLAIKRYGWAFPIEAIRRWHFHNSRCLYLMLLDGELVGYVDAFPISAADYQSLLDGAEEHHITPLKNEAVDNTCSFYIASVVIEHECGGLLPALIKRAVSFYCRSYNNKTWSRVCAIAYSPQGRTLLEKKQAQLLLGDNVEDRMFVVDRNMLIGLNKSNRALWSKLLPPIP
jgi:hypothetical protein